jgi:hypothetical protein
MTRVSCVVIGCKCTTGKSTTSEWICQKHWATVPKGARRRLQRNKRWIRREIRRNQLVTEPWKLKPGSRARIKAIRMWALHETLWQRCKRAAIERAVGL